MDPCEIVLTALRRWLELLIPAPRLQASVAPRGRSDKAEARLYGHVLCLFANGFSPSRSPFSRAIRAPTSRIQSRRSATLAAAARIHAVTRYASQCLRERIRRTEF